MRPADVVDLAAYRAARGAAPAQLPPAPDHELAHQRAAWDRVAAELAPLGVSAEAVLGPRP